MPELPEVETIARGLDVQVSGERIAAIVKLDWERMVETPDLPTFRRVLPGRHITRVGRRAKWLLCSLDAGWTLAFHLRMSGRLLVMASDTPPDTHTHLVLSLHNGQSLHFHDQRKFGRVRLLDPPGLAALDTAYGPEPLATTFRADDLAGVLAAHRTRLKPLLLNQRVLAGLGNIYVDESLWHARLHPLQSACTLTHDDATRLHTAIRAVLERAIVSGGSTLRDYRDGYGAFGRNQEHFAVYQRTGKPCPRCGTPIERLVVAQRGTHICPTCQQAG